MFSFKRSTVTTMAAVAVLALSVFGTSQAASAAVVSGPSAQASSTSSATTTDAPIAIPMVAVPHAGTKTGVQPNIVIPGSCGTAFLYPSNSGNHIHYDFGFEYLNNGPLYVTAHVGATNEDNGEADVNSFSEASFSSSWEKQGSLYTGIGQNEVSAYIYVVGFLHDCVSSPNLHQAVYVY